jgi:hypothetical protein
MPPYTPTVGSQLAHTTIPSSTARTVVRDVDWASRAVCCRMHERTIYDYTCLTDHQRSVPATTFLPLDEHNFSA